jgi:2-oxoglutarate dehydrogenase E1 component
MQVVYCTTPANVFHVLRRQIHREFRKPLIFFFSKSLLRHPLAKSKLADFSGDSYFHRVLADTAHEEEEFRIKPREGIKRLILCSGQVWTAIHKERLNKKIDGMAVLWI